MMRKIPIVILVIIFSLRLLQAQQKPILPYWNCPEEKSKMAQKMDLAMNKAIETVH
jgi:hypothetical protein